MKSRIIETNLIFEAVAEKKGNRWLVTIIGARKPEQLVTVGGREFIYSENGRLYDVAKLEESAGTWHNVKVYDDHLTQEEFDKRGGMRSPKNEWLGTIVKPVFEWVEGLPRLRGEFVVVESALASKLKNAWDEGVLESIGLSIDTFPLMGESVHYEGKDLPVIEGFRKIISVDLVGNPAAGGGFDRILASKKMESAMNEEQVKALIDEKFDVFQTSIAELGSKLDNALESNEPAEEADTEVETVEDESQDTEAEQAISDAVQEARLARCELALERKLTNAKLPEAMEKVVRNSFGGKVFENADLDKMVAGLKEAQVKADPTGQVKESGGQRETNNMQVFDEKDKQAVAFMQKAMGDYNFRAVESSKEDFVQEAKPAFYKAWENAGKPTLPRSYRMSELVRDMLGGNPLTDDIRMTEASTLASVTKNTVNIMIAADYSVQQRWYESIVRMHEVDTIDDATLVRLFGVDTLSVVPKGDAYTELSLEDEEETAAFVKRGNYVSVPIEDLMRDKLDFFTTIPRRLSDTWYNTLSSMVAGVFTTNSDAGPVLADTGALFNATATSSAGGHANLLTTALSYSAFSAARTAMRKQTNMPLGQGRKLQINPRYLLVPEDLETTALQIRNSEMQPNADGAGTTGNQTVNPFYQKFDVVTVPEWTDTNNWALVGDPVRNPAIHLIFPRGNRVPQLFAADDQTAGAMFTNDTLRWKVRMFTYEFSSSYRVAPVSDWRPLHKSNVA